MLTQSRLASASRLRTAALAPGLRARLAVSLVAAAVVLLACGGAAAAAPLAQITEFDQTNGLNAGGSPAGIAPGPDGNLWFTDRGTTKAIGRITPNGTTNELDNRQDP